MCLVVISARPCDFQALLDDQKNIRLAHEARLFELSTKETQPEMKYCEYYNIMKY